MCREHVAQQDVIDSGMGQNALLNFMMLMECPITIRSLLRPVFHQFWPTLLLTSRSGAYRLPKLVIFVPTTTTDRQTNHFTPCACAQDNYLVIIIGEGREFNLTSSINPLAHTHTLTLTHTMQTPARTHTHSHAHTLMKPYRMNIIYFAAMCYI